MGKTIFITGIDTDAGKTFATAYLAHLLRKQGFRVITQKPIETGNTEASQDLIKHDLLAPPCSPFEEENATRAQPFRNSYLFSLPASPHLSSSLEGRSIDTKRILSDNRQLLALGYDVVLMEGAGGLMVPLTKSPILTIDLIAEGGFPVVLVTSGKLGSINHTLLSLEALQRRSIPLWGMVYNAYPENISPIETDTRTFLQQILHRLAPEAYWIELPLWKENRGFETTNPRPTICLC